MKLLSPSVCIALLSFVSVDASHTSNDSSISQVEAAFPRWMKAPSANDRDALLTQSASKHHPIPKPWPHTDENPLQLPHLNKLFKDQPNLIHDNFAFQQSHSSTQYQPKHSIRSHHHHPEHSISTHPLYKHAHLPIHEQDFLLKSEMKKHEEEMTSKYKAHHEASKKHLANGGKYHVEQDLRHSIKQEAAKSRNPLHWRGSYYDAQLAAKRSVDPSKLNVFERKRYDKGDMRYLPKTYHKHVQPHHAEYLDQLREEDKLQKEEFRKRQSRIDWLKRNGSHPHDQHQSSHDPTSHTIEMKSHHHGHTEPAIGSKHGANPDEFEQGEIKAFRTHPPLNRGRAPRRKVLV
jgi:hypothetical protein